MNITFFITSLGGGGAERVLSDLANNMVQRGCSVDIVVLRGDQKQYELVSEVRIKYLQPEYYKSQKSRFYRLSEIAKVRSFLKGLQKDDLLVSFLELPMAYSLVFRNRVKSKLIICERSNPARYSKVYQSLFRYLSKRSDGCACQTRFVANWYSNFVGDKCLIKVIPNALADSLNQVVLKKNSITKIVTAGRLVPVKNHSLLLDAFAVVHKSFPDSELVIYGEGPLRQELENKVMSMELDECVLFPGFSHNVVDSIKDASVFVLSSDYEGMPNALAEAMAIGLPCVSTDYDGGGVHDLIENSVNGFIVPCNDCDSMSSAIISILKDKEMAERIGDNARLIKNRLDQRFIYQQWYDLFCDVIDNSNK